MWGVTHFSKSTNSLLHINFMLLGVLFSSALSDLNLCMAEPDKEKTLQQGQI